MTQSQSDKLSQNDTKLGFVHTAHPTRKTGVIANGYDIQDYCSEAAAIMKLKKLYNQLRMANGRKSIVISVLICAIFVDFIFSLDETFMKESRRHFSG